MPVLPPELLLPPVPVMPPEAVLPPRPLLPPVPVLPPVPFPPAPEPLLPASLVDDPQPSANRQRAPAAAIDGGSTEVHEIHLGHWKLTGGDGWGSACPGRVGGEPDRMEMNPSFFCGAEAE